MSQNARKFCINCGTYLRPSENDGKLILDCHKCGYNEPAEGLKISYYSRPQNRKNVDRVTPDFIYDVTFPRTKKIKCINKDCKGNNPEIVIVTSDKQLRVTYICTSCKTIWK